MLLTLCVAAQPKSAITLRDSACYTPFVVPKRRAVTIISGSEPPIRSGKAEGCKIGAFCDCASSNNLISSVGSGKFGRRNDPVAIRESAIGIDGRRRAA